MVEHMRRQPRHPRRQTCSMRARASRAWSHDDRERLRSSQGHIILCAQATDWASTSAPLGYGCRKPLRAVDTQWRASTPGVSKQWRDTDFKQQAEPVRCAYKTLRTAPDRFPVRLHRRTVPTIVPASRHNRASRANASPIGSIGEVTETEGFTNRIDDVRDPDFCLSKPPPSASRPPHRRPASIRDKNTHTKTLDREAVRPTTAKPPRFSLSVTARVLCSSADD